MMVSGLNAQVGVYLSVRSRACVHPSTHAGVHEPAPYLVVELDQGPFGHVVPLQFRHRGPHAEGHLARVRQHGQVDAVRVVDPVARVVVRGDGDAGGHGRQEAAHHLVQGDAQGLEDGRQKRAPLGVVHPGQLEAAPEEVVAVDEDDL